MQHQIAARVIRCFIAVDQHHAPARIAHKPRRGIHGQRRAANDQKIRRLDRAHRAVNILLAQRLAIHHNVRADHSAACAVRNAIRLQNRIERIPFAAAHAIIAMHRAVQLDHPAAARGLMQPIDILRNHRGKKPHLLKLRQRLVRRIGARRGIEHVFLIKIIKFRRMPHQKIMMQNLLTRQLHRLIKPMRAAEIRNAALCRDSRAAKKRHAPRAP